MELVTQRKPTEDNLSPWAVEDLGPFYKDAVTLRRFLQKISTKLKGKPAYLVFNKEEDEGMFGIRELVSPLLAGCCSADEVCKLLTQTVCNNTLFKRCTGKYKLHAVARYFYPPEEWLKKEGFYEDKSEKPLSFWFNVLTGPTTKKQHHQRRVKRI